MSSRLIVLLGNPGDEYEDTRHNIAWWVGDQLADRRHLTFTRDGDALRAEGRIGGQRACLLKPLTYMNRSGEAVARVFNELKLTPADALIVSDDIDLPLGTVRIRNRGSSGGHRGLESIFQSLATQDVARCRCGVGPVPPGVDPAEFVLDHFNSDELIIARQMASTAADAVEMILARGVAVAANTFNRKPSASDSATNGHSDAQRPREDE